MRATGCLTMREERAKKKTELICGRLGQWIN
jgi:hypothetical protein